jgi:hypothetical protein
MRVRRPSCRAAWTSHLPADQAEFPGGDEHDRGDLARVAWFFANVAGKVAYDYKSSKKVLVSGAYAGLRGGCERGERLVLMAVQERGILAAGPRFCNSASRHAWRCGPRAQINRRPRERSVTAENRRAGRQPRRTGIVPLSLDRAAPTRTPVSDPAGIGSGHAPEAGPLSLRRPGRPVHGGRNSPLEPRVPGVHPAHFVPSVSNAWPFSTSGYPSLKVRLICGASAPRLRRGPTAG